MKTSDIEEYPPGHSCKRRVTLSHGQRPLQTERAEDLARYLLLRGGGGIDLAEWKKPPGL